MTINRNAVSGALPGVLLNFFVVENATYGDVTPGMDMLTYTPEVNYKGPDSFTFNATQGNVTSNNTGNVTVAVGGLRVEPLQILEVPVNTEEKKTNLTINRNAVSGALPGVLLNFSVVENATYGDVTPSKNMLTYTPEVNYTGPDSFTFRATQGNVTSNTGNVTVAVGGLRVEELQTISVKKNNNLTINRSAVSGALPGVLLNFSVVDGPTYGDVTPSKNMLTYTPEVNYTGPDSFTFRVYARQWSQQSWGSSSASRPKTLGRPPP